MLWTCKICRGVLRIPNLPWCDECDRIPLWRATPEDEWGSPSISSLEGVAFRFWLGGLTYSKLLQWKGHSSITLQKHFFSYEKEELLRLRALKIELITWIPQNPLRSLQLGRSPARECALHLSKALGRIPVWNFLNRDQGLSTRQAELTRWQRESRELGFRVKSSLHHKLPSRRILLVDDFFTTGQTLSEGARALKDAGAVSVWGWCLGKRPVRYQLSKNDHNS